MQWNGEKHSIFVSTGPFCTQDIVAWINANGGEVSCIDTGPLAVATNQKPLIAVRTHSGWAYAAPGDYVVMQSKGIDRADPDSGPDLPVVKHYFDTCDPETFESRWLPVSLDPTKEQK